MPLPPRPPPPPRASAPTPLKTRAPATRSPVRDRLIDRPMITFPSLLTSSAKTVDPNCLCYKADRSVDLLCRNCRTSRKVWNCHIRVTASFSSVILSGKHDENKELYLFPITGFMLKTRVGARRRREGPSRRLFRQGGRDRASKDAAFRHSSDDVAGKASSQVEMIVTRDEAYIQINGRSAPTATCRWSNR